MINNANISSLNWELHIRHPVWEDHNKMEGWKENTGTFLKWGELIDFKLVCPFSSGGIVFKLQFTLQTRFPFLY